MGCQAQCEDWQLLTYIAFIWRLGSDIVSEGRGIDQFNYSQYFENKDSG